MRSLAMRGHGIVEVIEAPDPVPGPGEVVVEIAGSALCGSELHTYRGKGLAKGNSGHEAAGRILELGPGVGCLQVGERVGLSGVVGCGYCEECVKGRQTYCQNRPSYGSMHAERVVIVAHGCLPLPDDAPWDVGVLISGDGMGVPYHTSRKIASPDVHTIAIFGLGPIGLGSTLLQSYLGRDIIGVDVQEVRLRLAHNLGAVHTINAAADDPVAAIRSLTGGRGADVCIEAAGRPETLKQCFAAVRTAGSVVMNGEQPVVELSPSNDFIRRDITAVGSWFYHLSEFPEMLALYRDGLPVASLITHRYPLSDADTAFAEFAAGHTGKVLLLMNE